MKKLLYGALSMVVTFGPAPAHAQSSGPNAPDSLSFQGFLTDDSGVPFDDAVDMTFKLYIDETEVWSQTKSGVVVTDGVFNVILGGTGTASLDKVAFNVPIELGIKVGCERGHRDRSERGRLSCS